MRSREGFSEEECWELGEEALPHERTARAKVWSLAHFKVITEQSGPR